MKEPSPIRNSPAMVLALGAGTSLTAAETPMGLEVLPPAGKFLAPSAAQRLVVLGPFADGSRRDMTGAARFDSIHPEVSGVDPGGTVPPVTDGSAEIAVPVDGGREIILEAKPDAPPSDRVPIAVMGHVSINFVVKTAYSSAPVLVTVVPKADR